MSTKRDRRNQCRSWQITTGSRGVRRSLWWPRVGLVFFLLLYGCAAQSSRTTAAPPDALEAAYRAGLHTALRGYQEEMLDHDFPYTNWNPPLVQRVWIPARITGGVFIPGHMEDVIITPGAWKREFSAPLSTQQSPSQTRPFTRDRVVGSADRPLSAAGVDGVAAPSRVPVVPRSTTRTSRSGQGWIALPPPGAHWGITP
jgi:hypothetical protein